MRVLHTRDDLRFLDELKRKRPLVLVPTMGALHEGHLSLVREAERYGAVVATIFVNPTQFGPGEDYDAYPRDLESDLERLRPLNVEAVFAPPVSLMYPEGSGVSIQPGSRGLGLCGGDRPGHFAGVLTVVAKLFGLTRPEIAVFGRKDAQQCLVIDQMVRDLEFPVRLIDAPTIREGDGLAMSSRNRYLDAEERSRALCLSQALREAERLVAGGERSAGKVRQRMWDHLSPADEIRYAEIRSVPDLQEPERMEGRILLAVSAQVGPARLIDNLVLEISDDAVREGSLLGDGER